MIDMEKQKKNPCDVIPTAEGRIAWTELVIGLRSWDGD